VHLHLPIVELGAGGSVLTGAGGDQVLAGWRRPTPNSPLRILAHHLRAFPSRHRRRADLFPWLHPEASQEIQREYRSERRREPRQLGRRITWHTYRRDLLGTCSSLARIAADHDVALVNPLLDGGFLAALTVQAGGRRRRTRTELLAEIAAGSLPDVVTAPRPKARFLEVFLRAPTRHFVRTWDGSGADEDLVDVAALRDLWSRWPIPGGTAGLVQSLWLKTNPVPELSSVEAHR
jgi:asparagine synthase (glutamine-hydrolysing)